MYSAKAIKITKNFIIYLESYKSKYSFLLLFVYYFAKNYSNSVATTYIFVVFIRYL